MTTTTATGAYRVPVQSPEIRRHFRPGDRVNVAVYRPGEPCDALPGSPTFKDCWCVAMWWPGIREEYDLAVDEAGALRLVYSWTGAKLAVETGWVS